MYHILSDERFISSSSILQVRIRRNLACVIAQESPPEVFRVDRFRIVATRMPMSGFHLSVNLSERYGLSTRGVFVGRGGITGNFPLVPGLGRRRLCPWHERSSRTALEITHAKRLHTQH